MKRLIPSPAMAVALIALFVAMGGSSYAAVKLKANSVTSREIKNGSITPADLATSAKVSKSNRLFRSAVVDTVTDPASGVTIHVQSEPGIVGPQGAAGTNGAQGAPGPASVVKREGVGPDVGTGGQSGANATCQPGEKITGGGAVFEATTGAGGAALTMSQPTDGAQAWSANYTVTGPSTSGHIRVFALCAS